MFAVVLHNMALLKTYNISAHGKRLFSLQTTIDSKSRVTKPIQRYITDAPTTDLREIYLGDQIDSVSLLGQTAHVLFPKEHFHFDLLCGKRQYNP